MLPTHLSATPFCQGLRTLVRTALIPLPCKELADLDVEPAVTVEDHIAVRAWSWQCLPQLLQDRLAGGMRRDIEVENLTSLILDDKEAVEHVER